MRDVEVLPLTERATKGINRRPRAAFGHRDRAVRLRNCLSKRPDGRGATPDAFGRGDGAPHPADKRRPAGLSGTWSRRQYQK